MKLFILTAMSSILMLCACKKDTLITSQIASLNVTAAVLNGGDVKLNTNEKDSAKAYNAKLFTIKSGESKVRLFPTNSPSDVYFDGTISTAAGDIYSVFLTGQLPNIDNILIKENIPAPYTDSVVGVRVINLSPNSTPFNITLQSASTVNVFSSVSYKQLTDFEPIAVKTIIPSGSVSFQVRNGANNALLATYTLPTSINSTYPGISIAKSRFNNITLVIKGLQGTSSGANALGVFPVANY